MAWAKERTTTRDEDAAYCLLGIFDIQMPLIYGEGKEKARKRLQKEIKESSGDAVAILVSNTPITNPARDKTLSKIRQWLSSPNPSVNYEKALKLRQHDTGLWFLDGERYANWKIDAASYLWLHGIPGCGKTILSSTILQDLFLHREENPGHAVAYFYFDFNDVQKQSSELMLRSLVSQLFQQVTKVPTSLEALFPPDEEGRKSPPSLDLLLQVTPQIMQQFPQVYVMLDALDECAHRPDLLEILGTIVGWQLQNLHLIMTSRRERDIESSLEEYVDPHNTICLQSDIVDQDIQRYVQQRLSEEKSLCKWGKDVGLRQEIETTLMAGSKGMYVFCTASRRLTLTT
jgi:hypothetical protein